MSKDILTRKRKRVVWWNNFLAKPGYSSCDCCGGSWDWNKGHSTNFNETRGCFPLCEWCWSRLTIEQRLPYYEDLVFEWRAQTFYISDKVAKDKALADLDKQETEIVAAVMAGL